MKAKELIALLERFDTDQEVVIAIRQQNKRYPIARVKPFGTDNYDGTYIVIGCTLPEKMHTVTKK